MFAVRLSSFARRAFLFGRKVIACFTGFVVASSSVAAANCTFGTDQSPPSLGPAAAAFNGTAMTSPSDVWAVGALSSEFGTAIATLAEHWNGSSWTIVSTPSPGLAPYFGDGLNSVAAVSSSDVWAVGQAGLSLGGESALIEHWDGTAWAVVPSPQVSSSTLTSVSATSSTNVWAAGSYHTSQGYRALVEVWNGSTWSLVSDSDSAVTSISATSPTDVWATANDVEHWDGSSWSIVSTLPASAVTAVASNDVWVIEANTQLAHWDGSTWHVVSSPQIGNLHAISANTSNNAWAVGLSSSNQPVTEHWDGSTWSQVNAPNGSHSGGLLAVALNGSSAFAVGDHASEPHRELQGLQIRWDGSKWLLALGPPVDELSDTLQAAVIPTPGDMWAVGAYAFGGSLQFPDPIQGALIERSVNGTWSTYKAPNGIGWLGSVASHSSTDVWAAGAGTGPCGSGQAVATHWNGARWAADSPNICAGAGSEFSAIAMDAEDVWAVGFDNEPGAGGSQVTHELVARRHGGTWTVMGMPDDPYSSGLTSVFDGSRDDVWAVGVNAPSRHSSINIIYHWNGSTWSDQMVQDPEPIGFIDAIADRGPTDVWAVGGEKRDGNGPFEPLILHYDGTTWSVATHGASGFAGALTSVSIASARDVVASSTDYIARWNGYNWRFIGTPPDVLLSGVARVPTSPNFAGFGESLTPYLNARAVAWSILCQ